MAAEAKHINKSLTFLEQVVVALGDRRRTHVPFRNSKLTHVLHDSLGGNCMTLMIANVWADLEQLPVSAVYAATVVVYAWRCCWRCCWRARARRRRRLGVRCVVRVFFTVCAAHAHV